jgi:hypothetical protein
LCQDCGHEIPIYNSCRNRHCPKCQNLNQARWVEAQARHLLPVPYFHLVFTVPDSLHPLFLRDPRQTYNLLFDAVAGTVLAVCGQQMGATPGLTAVLHTWNQKLLFHPHVHCIITGGGLSQDRQRWIASRSNFLVSVRQLSTVFRGKLLARLEAALQAGDLHTNTSFGLGILRQASPKWNVHCKPPMAGPKQVLSYLGRYSHRVAIGNERLVSLEDSHVTFLWRDRSHNNRVRSMRILATAFARRFLLHALPHRYVRIRHRGLRSSPAPRARSTGTEPPTHRVVEGALRPPHRKGPGLLSRMWVLVLHRHRRATATPSTHRPQPMSYPPLSSAYRDVPSLCHPFAPLIHRCPPPPTAGPGSSLRGLLQKTPLTSSPGLFCSG